MIRLTLSFVRQSMQAYRDILLNAVGLTRRTKLNFTTGFYAADNASIPSTDVAVVSHMASDSGLIDSSSTVQAGRVERVEALGAPVVITLAAGSRSGQQITIIRVESSDSDVTFLGTIEDTNPTLGSTGVSAVTFWWDVPSEGAGRWFMLSSLVTNPRGQSVRIVAGTAYTTAIEDANSVIETSSGSSVNVTIPPNASVAYPIGTRLTVVRGGDGGVTILEGSGVTVTVAFEIYADPPVVRGKFGVVELVKTATNTWRAFGDLNLFS